MAMELARALVHVRGMENVAAMADIKGTFVLNAMMAIMKTLTTLVKNVTSLVKALVLSLAQKDVTTAKMDGTLARKKDA